MSETSQTMSSCGDSGEQSFTIVINPFDRGSDTTSIEAEKVAVNNKRLNDCWPRVTVNEWNNSKGSLQNPGSWTSRNQIKFN